MTRMKMSVKGARQLSWNVVNGLTLEHGEGGDERRRDEKSEHETHVFDV